MLSDGKIVMQFCYLQGGAQLGAGIVGAGARISVASSVGQALQASSHLVLWRPSASRCAAGDLSLFGRRTFGAHEALSNTRNSGSCHGVDVVLPRLWFKLTAWWREGLVEWCTRLIDQHCVDGLAPHLIAPDVAADRR